MRLRKSLRHFSCLSCLKGFYQKCSRTKTVGADFFETELKRCLKLIDIILLGTGHMIGAGIYIITGAATKNTAGPSVIISYIMSGFAAFLAALCYAEFGGRVPKAGSAYSYGYVTIGEFWGFIIGWDMLLENMIGAAALGVAWSGYLNELCDHKISSGIDHLIGKINDPLGILGERLELIAPTLIILVSIFMGLGARTSTTFNNVFAGINLVVILFTVIFGLTFAIPAYWTDPYSTNCTYQSCNLHNATYNGTCTSADAFMPYGFGGVMKGAAQVFFSFVGFESIASAGEETINPKRTIPFGTLIAMIIVTTSYVLMALTLSMMVPFCKINSESAFATVFANRGATWAKYVVAVGALSGMTTVLFGSLFATPRGVYAMANDGLLCRCLGYVHPRSQVPLVGVILFGIISVILSMIFNLDVLAEFVSIGTLLAYSIVACSVIVLRYRPNAAKFGGSEEVGFDDPYGGRLKHNWMFLDPVFHRFPPGSAVTMLSAIMVVNMFSLAAIIHFGHWETGLWWSLLLLIIFAITALACCLLIFAFEPAKATLQFKVPLVPFLPAFSLLLNIIFMLHLPGLTWLRFGVWLIIGCLIYFSYGMWHSHETYHSNAVHPTAPDISPQQLTDMKKPVDEICPEKPPPYTSTAGEDHISNVSTESHGDYDSKVYDWKKKF